MRLRDRLRARWFADDTPTNLAMARVVVAGTTLWMVLSRYDLPSVVAFPREMWSAVTPWQQARFGLVLPLAAEGVLWAVLHGTLVMAFLGVWPRVACIMSSLLVYHFGPLETIFWTRNPYLRGFTIPVLALAVLGASRCGDALSLTRPRNDPEPGDYVWPLMLIQLFFAQIYFFAGYAKLFTSGFGWISATNIQHYLLALNQYLGFPRDSFAYALAPYPLLCAGVAWTGMLFELTWPILLIWPKSRWVMIPVTLLFHAANAVLFRILFQNVVLLLLFVNWEWAAARIRRALSGRPTPALAK